MADRIVHLHRPRGCFTEVNVMMPISQTEKLRHGWMEKNPGVLALGSVPDFGHCRLPFNR